MLESQEIFFIKDRLLPYLKGYNVSNKKYSKSQDQFIA